MVTVLLRTTSRLSPRAGSHRIIGRSSFGSRRNRHTLEHPQYPGLYYHPVEQSSSDRPQAYSLSFLDQPPPSLELSPTTIGILTERTPSSPSSSSSSSSLPELVPRNFQENHEFKQVMHDILREAIKGDLVLDTLAKNRPEDGFIHLADARAPADPNRVPDPSDLIAHLLVQDQRVVEASYEPSQTHRLVTVDGGMMRLEQGLFKRFVEGLKKVRAVEEQYVEEMKGQR